MDTKDAGVLMDAVYGLRGCGLLVQGLANFVVSVGEPARDRDLLAACDRICDGIEEACGKVESVAGKADMKGV